MNYVLIRENIGVIASHSDFKKIKEWRNYFEKKFNDNIFIFKEVIA